MAPPARAAGGSRARWLLRQLAFWLLVPLLAAVIWKIVTWPVKLPGR